jgi:transposase
VSGVQKFIVERQALGGTQVTVLQTLQTVISDVERLIAVRVVAHPRSNLFENLPGVGMINLAQLLAEVCPILDRVHSAEQAATECGAAPVTRSSGQTRGVYFRWVSAYYLICRSPYDLMCRSVSAR